MIATHQKMSLHFSALALFAAVLMALLAMPVHSQTPSEPAYPDPSLPVEKRVDDLVSRMTLDEKVAADAAYGARNPAAWRSVLRLVE